MILKYKDHRGFWEFLEIKEFSYQNFNKKEAQEAFNRVREKYITSKEIKLRNEFQESIDKDCACMIYEDEQNLTFHLLSEEAYLINNEGKTIERIN